MKVYVKKEVKPSMIPGLIVASLFIGVSILCMYIIFKSNDSFLEKITSQAEAVAFTIFFLFFGVYFIYALIRKPVKYKAKLVSKELQMYHENQITVMTFECKKRKKQKEVDTPSVFECYSIEPNDFVVDKEYSLLIKEFHWLVKEVEPLSGQKDVQKYIPNAAMKVVFILIELLVFVIAVLKTLAMLVYPKLWVHYLFESIIFISIFVVTYIESKRWLRNNT